MIRHAAAFAAFALLAACATPVSDAPQDNIVDPSGGRECPADEFQMLVGQLGGEIDTSTLPVPHRIYGRGDAVTMDYRSDRMNIVVGDDGRVERVSCG